MADVSQFAGLPLGQLIAQPIIEVAKGQAALCNVYLSYLYKLAYEKGKVGGKTNVLTFNLNRPVVDKSGATKTQSVKVEAPLLSGARACLRHAGGHGELLYGAEGPDRFPEQQRPGGPEPVWVQLLGLRGQHHR